MKDVSGDSRSTECLAAEVNREENDKTENLPQRVSRYANAKARSLQMAGYCKTSGDVKMSYKLKGCGNYLVFHDYYTADQVRLHGASFCKCHLLCNLCAIRRASKGMQAYLQKYAAVIKENLTLIPYFVTLTTANGEDLPERYQHLSRSVRRLLRSRRNARAGQKFVEFVKAEGGFFSIEVTNIGNGWHVHIHMVWLCATSPDAFKLSKEWHAITGDSFIVDVRPIQGELVDGFCEVFKYALKFSDLSLEHNYEAYQVLKGQRLFDSFGNMKGVDIPESLLDEPLDDLPYIERFYKYIQGQGFTQQWQEHYEVALKQPPKDTTIRPHAQRTTDKNGSGFQFRPIPEDRPERTRAHIIADIFRLPIS